MKYIRTLWRFLFFLFYTGKIVVEIWLRNRFQGPDIRRAMRIRRRWANTLLKQVGVRVRLMGTPPNFPCLMVSNHRSYLDPILMLCQVDGFPVAKAELASWPLIGKGAKMAGILYLKRENAKSRAGTLRGIQEIIEQGHPVIIFPEGTTSSLPTTLPFKKGVFQLASKSAIPVVPVAVHYHDRADHWVGRQSFLGHAGKRFAEKYIEVTLSYGPPIGGGTPEEILVSAQGWINETIISLGTT